MDEKSGKMKRILENPFLSLLARLVLGIVFILASVGKIADPSSFAKEIYNYGLVMEPMINLMALILPWIEIIIAIFIILGVRLKASAAISSFLLVIFIIAITIAVSLGKDINCGCFANSSAKVGLQKILEDVGLLILSLYIVFFPVKKLTFESFFNWR